MGKISINVDVVEKSIQKFNQSTANLNAGKQENIFNKSTIMAVEDSRKHLGELSYIMAKLQNVLEATTKKVEAGKVAVVTLDNKIAGESE